MGEHQAGIFGDVAWYMGMTYLGGVQALEGTDRCAKLVGTMTKGAAQFGGRQLIHKGQGHLEGIDGWFHVPPVFVQKAVELSFAALGDDIGCLCARSLPLLTLCRVYRSEEHTS